MVGGSHLHNNATSWPNLQVRSCKNSSQVEFQVGPSVAKTMMAVWVAQAMWWVAHAMWSGLRRLCGGFL